MCDAAPLPRNDLCALDPALWGGESLAQESEGPRRAGQRRDHVPTEAYAAVGHVGSLASVHVDELVCIGDGEVLLMHAAPGRVYYQRKIAEGKSKKEALRALKRGISDAVWRQLQVDLASR